MRKIDKSEILSQNYKVWLENLGDVHPKYKSSHKFYTDIKMSLLHCQKGLCAYTEELLCDPKLINTNNWNDGKYSTDLSSENLVNGDLEHFDATLKTKQGWQWDNLFFVNSNVNCRVKGTKEVDFILKPDASHYDENKYLQFDYETNIFIPNINLSEEEKHDVSDMIQTLGINCNAFKRAKQLQELKNSFELGLPLKEPDEYITSWKMTHKALIDR